MTQWNEPPQAGQYGQQPGFGAQPDDPTRAYGNPGHGTPPPYGAQPGGGFQQRLEQSESFGIVGTVMTLLGGILTLVGMTAVDWFARPNSSFSEVHDVLAADNLANGFSKAYFAWLAWLFLVVAVVAGVLAAVPSPALRIFRIIGIVVGVAAAGLTFLALNFGEGTSYLSLLKHARLGFYFAVVGFLVAGIGAGIGPRKV